MKLIAKIILVFILLISSSTGVAAIVDPLSYPNNKYGIHITDENDYYSAENLVNSSGGDWGYVTFVIADTDRNADKWQKNFDLLRGLHLIPIVRLATHPDGNIWVKPKAEDIDSWVNFLNSLYWVTQNRYIVLFNEPNHGEEWGGIVNPADYADILEKFSHKLKESSADFFILPAGLDASAPNSRNSMDEEEFLREMIWAKPEIFTLIDGWTSHSYPNPGFRGEPTDSGRGTLTTYKWELDTLETLGQKLNLPIFITETGWPHKEGIGLNNSFYSAGEISSFILQAAKIVWNDPQIAAVTPFILNYPSYPFANFSWKVEDGSGFYPYFDIYKSISKVAGRPRLNSVFGNFSGLTLTSITSVNTASGIVRTIPVLDINFWRSLFYHRFKL